MSREFFNQRAAGWDQTVAEKDTAKLQRLANHLTIRPGDTVLDVGTGTGVMLPWLLAKTGPQGQILALDFAEKMLRVARNKRFWGNVHYLEADIASIPLDNEICDAVVCYSSFPHFLDKPRALREINRVTKTGGRLFICHTSGRDAINQIHRGIPAVSSHLIPGQEEMARMLATAGFQDIIINDAPDSYLATTGKPIPEQ